MHLPRSRDQYGHRLMVRGKLRTVTLTDLQPPGAPEALRAVGMTIMLRCRRVVAAGVWNPMYFTPDELSAIKALDAAVAAEQ